MLFAQIGKNILMSSPCLDILVIETIQKKTIEKKKMADILVKLQEKLLTFNFTMEL